MPILPILIIDSSSDTVWLAVTALATAALVFVAIFAYNAAIEQVRAAVAGTTEARRIARIERTSNLLAEFGSDENEALFGFFDVAYECDNSRLAIRELYDATIVRQRNRVLQAEDALPEEQKGKEFVRSAVEDLYSDIDRGISGHRPSISEVSESDRGAELKRRILAISNRCERAWVLIENNAIDAKVILKTQDYNIVATYYILEDILFDLYEEEAFDFEMFRQLAIMSQESYRKEPNHDETLANAVFKPFPD